MATTNEDALAHTLRELPGWQRHGDSIRRTYQFDDFASATLFVGRVADATAAAGHQPDIAIRGGRVTLELAPRTGSTLTADDLMVAERIQRLVGDHHHPVGRAAPWSPSDRLTGIRQRPVGPAGP
jgi:4a-hydroxytetrahydrobiopterin dehydratase